MDEEASTEAMRKGLQTFRLLLNKFKRPYIEKLEEYGADSDSQFLPGKEDPLSDEELQQVNKIQMVLKAFDKLYAIIGALLQRADDGMSPGGEDLDTKAVYSVLSKHGILDVLKDYPSLRDEMMKFLKIELKLYPFTLNTKLVNSFLSRDVEPSRNGKIIPNE